MEQMTSRQRMLAACLGKQHDRVPWCPEINAHFIDEHLREAGIDPSKVGNSYVEANKLIGADTLLGVAPYQQYCDDTVKDGTEETEKEIVRVISTPVGTLTQKTRKCPDARTDFMYAPLIKTKDDYGTFQYVLEHTKIRDRYADLEEAEKILGDDGIISLTAPATPLMDLIMLYMGVENTLVQMLEYEKEFDELCASIHEFYKKVFKVVAQAPSAIMVRPFEDTSTSLYSPAAFRKHCLGQLKDYADIIHKGDKLFVPHMCGFLKGVLDILPQADIDGIEAITPPPTGDTPISLAREKLGPDMILIGGLDPTELSTRTTQDMQEIISSVLDSMAGDRKFMLSCEEISVMANMKSVLSVERLVREKGALN